MSVYSVAAQAVAECERQDDLWGRQDHTPAQWLAILTEEVGEVAKEIADGLGHPFKGLQYRAELVQVAAVALQAVWAFDRLAIRTTTSVAGRIPNPAFDRMAWMHANAGADFPAEAWLPEGSTGIEHASS